MSKFFTTINRLPGRYGPASTASAQDSAHVRAHSNVLSCALPGSSTDPDVQDLLEGLDLQIWPSKPLEECTQYIADRLVLGTAAIKAVCTQPR